MKKNITILRRKNRHCCVEAAAQSVQEKLYRVWKSRRQDEKLVCGPVGPVFRQQFAKNFSSCCILQGLQNAIRQARVIEIFISVPLFEVQFYYIRGMWWFSEHTLKDAKKIANKLCPIVTKLCRLNLSLLYSIGVCPIFCADYLKPVPTYKPIFSKLLPGFSAISIDKRNKES